MERTLSNNEARIILELEWRNQKTVTLAELREEGRECSDLSLAELEERWQSIKCQLRNSG